MGREEGSGMGETSPKAPEGPEKKKAEQEYQKGELERSIKYLREVVGLGLKA